MAIDENEYKKHKEKCSQTFKDIQDQLGKMNRAMFGEKDLKRPGVFEMTTEMYNSMRMAKSGQQIFWVTVKIAGGVTVLIGAFWATYEFFKRIVIN